MRNFSTWPIDRSLPAGLIDTAADVFAFDALIQNPDRSFKNPNLGMEGGTLRVFDHECAFSFVYSIFPIHQPWDLSGEKYLDDHVFAGQLRKKPVNWQPFFQQLAGLDTGFFAQIASALPIEWDASRLPAIESHLIGVRDHSGDFEMELRRRIA